MQISVDRMFKEMLLRMLCLNAEMCLKSEIFSAKTTAAEKDLHNSLEKNKVKLDM